MARPSKQTAEYFPHFVADSRTKFTLEHYWGNDGYAFWFKLLELLCRTDGQAYSCAEVENWEYLLAYTKVSDSTAEAILSKLAALGKVDKELWENHRMVWCDGLIKGLSSLYAKRTAVPQKPSFRSENNATSVVSDTKTGVSGAEMPQSKVKKREVKDIPPYTPQGENPDMDITVCKAEPTGAVLDQKNAVSEIVSFLNLTLGTSYRESNEKTRTQIRARINEGFTVDDFKTVIQRKFADWGNDPKMSKYLRPETLFGTKFESYLNHPDKKASAGNPYINMMKGGSDSG